MKGLVVRSSHDLRLYPYKHCENSFRFTVDKACPVKILVNEYDCWEKLGGVDEPIVQVYFFTENDDPMSDLPPDFFVIVTRNVLCVLDDCFRIFSRYTGLNITDAY